MIQIRPGELHLIATEAETALIEAEAPLFSRGGIVRPIIDEMQAAGGRLTKVARLGPIDADALIDHLSRAADWQKWNARDRSFVACDPPRSIAAVILSRAGEWRFRPLSGLISTPTLRPDCTILAKPGYDAATRLWLFDPPELPRIPIRPSKDDAASALQVLDALLDDFPFTGPESRAVALSGLLTPVLRGAMAVAPLHAYTAPTPGSGKSYLVDLASAILTGDRAPVISAGRSEEETEKRLASALLGGLPLVSLDNLNGELTGAALCQMIERPIVSLRPLGHSKLVPVESRSTLFTTGNNISVVADLTRRVILCSLDPNMERPELRNFRSKPFEDILADRAKYISAALTIGRAYAAAGFPEELPPIASFEAWSRIVRSALVWLGAGDPVSTMVTARAEDPELSTLNDLLQGWHRAVGSSKSTTGRMKELAEQRDPFGNFTHGELRQASLAVAETRGEIYPQKLGCYLARHKGRIVGGLKLRVSVDSHSKQKLWSVGPVE